MRAHVDDSPSGVRNVHLQRTCDFYKAFRLPKLHLLVLWKMAAAVLPKDINKRGEGLGQIALVAHTCGNFRGSERGARRYTGHHLLPCTYHCLTTSMAGLPQGVCEPSSGPPKPLVPTFHQYMPWNQGCA